VSPTADLPWSRHQGATIDRSILQLPYASRSLPRNNPMEVQEYRVSCALQWTTCLVISLFGISAYVLSKG